MHGDPHVPNDGRAGRGFPLRAGLVIALEPWFLATTDELVTDPDGWTLRSADGSRGAHSEHTVAITEDGPDRPHRSLVPRRALSGVAPRGPRHPPRPAAPGAHVPSCGHVPHDSRMPDRLFLARHGQTVWNRERRLQGQLDSPLTDAGVEHARAVARRLEGAGVGLICTSPLGRARRTAEIIAEALGVEVVQVDELAEIHHGSFAGRTWDELEESSPGIRELRSENRYGWAFPGGESYASARPRAIRALDELLLGRSMARR